MLRRGLKYSALLSKLQSLSTLMCVPPHAHSSESATSSAPKSAAHTEDLELHSLHHLLAKVLVFFFHLGIVGEVPTYTQAGI